MGSVLGNKPFAFLLCNFNNSQNPTPFTLAQANAGVEVIRQFWTATTYGSITLDGSTVTDWFTLPIKNSDFIADYNGVQMIQYAKDHSGIDQSKYVGFVVIFSEPVGTAWTQYLGQTPVGAIFEPSIIGTFLICHEMTHILGEPNHSFDFSGRKDADWSPPGQYFDQVDIMSAANCWPTATVAGNPFSGNGPHHCMIWKDQLGWLGQSRVRRIQEKELEKPFGDDIYLLQRDSPPDIDYGVIAVFYRDMSVEFCTQTGFDAGLQGAGVVIHESVDGGSSYREPWVVVPDASSPDQKFWSVGQVCTRVASPGTPDAGDDYYVWVREINLAKGYARISISNGIVPPFARVQVKAIRKGYSKEKHHEFISDVGVDNGQGGFFRLSRADVIAWIETGRNTFFVQGADGSTADVIVENHWIKTVADNSTADNLYSLPLF